MRKENIVLIGMPWSGKSTIGVLLAKALKRKFLDTDLLIQSNTGKSLQEIINTEGVENFRKIEEELILSLRLKNYVVSTGGSVIYSDKAMSHLRSIGWVVYLRCSYETILQRAQFVELRGLVKTKSDQTLLELYNERCPLYESYAEITITCDGLKHEEIVNKITSLI
ncbi:MAG: shikimate kinase [Candidatus Hydrogenedentes bacterium]|nr:shikimate kinase [Candidatus Hydrogenedentota bacterium]